MKILILTTYYPPDTAIAAVRPYMLAKYLSRLGHSITVLRAGSINKLCDNYFEDLPDVHLISFLGENSPAEVFARGEATTPQKKGKSRISFLPEKIRLPISKCYYWVMKSHKMAKHMEQRTVYFEKQKVALDKLKEEGNSFDIVFSTFGELENVFGGQYAAQLFNCKLVQDFRDTMAGAPFCRGKVLRQLKELQTETVYRADAVTAVSQGLLQELYHGVEIDRPRLTLYNGYEPIADKTAYGDEWTLDTGLFTICYTGQIYSGLSDFSPILHALKVLKDQKKIDLSKVCIHYAGSGAAHLTSTIASLQLGDILVNHGYVSRSEAARLQSISDIFVVLSWNTAKSQGILTGKFYEGIRAGKPILSVISGDVPHSELDMLNEKYNYGFCYETVREKTQFSQLCDFLYTAYTQKMEHGHIDYHPNPALVTDFQYDTLAKKLEDLCYQLLKDDKKDV